jgi:hypothetical protein
MRHTRCGRTVLPEAWTKSEAFRAAHASAGGNKPLYLGHPQFEGFETIQTVKRGKAAAARYRRWRSAMVSAFGSDAGYFPNSRHSPRLV